MISEKYWYLIILYQLWSQLRKIFGKEKKSKLVVKHFIKRSFKLQYNVYLSEGEPVNISALTHFPHSSYTLYWNSTVPSESSPYKDLHLTQILK